jgi:alanine racemase
MLTSMKTLAAGADFNPPTLFLLYRAVGRLSGGLSAPTLRVVALASVVATLPIGYNDGYLRGLSNRGRIIVRGTYAPVIGRVSMDLTLVDVTNVPEVALDDIVTLLGNAPDGHELSIAVEDIARTVGTISYEVTCGISHRVPRFYLQ